jgi:hypothetical protein
MAVEVLDGSRLRDSLPPSVDKSKFEEKERTFSRKKNEEPN